MGGVGIKPKAFCEGCAWVFSETVHCIFNSFCSYLPVSVKYSWQKSKQLITAREITFNIVKKEEGPYWPRLYKEGKKVRLAILVLYLQCKKQVNFLAGCLL